MMRYLLIVTLQAALIFAAPQADANKAGAKMEKMEKKAAAKAAAKAPATPAATDAEIAAAKAKGLVWVNLNTKVYHSAGEMYGKTKHGQFMTEEEAKKAGNRAAREPGQKKAKMDKKTDVKK